jgi:hypothetical protein
MTLVSVLSTKMWLLFLFFALAAQQTRGLLFYLLLKLIQINFIFSDKYSLFAENGVIVLNLNYRPWQ